MKTILKYFAWSLFVLTAVFLIAGCSKDKPGSDAGGEAEGSAKDIYVQSVSDIAEYRIVRPDKGDAEKKALVALRSGFKSKLELDMKVGTDFDGTAAKEILIGATNRPESAEAAEGLRMGDFRVCQINGKIVIVGGSEKALMDAMDFVIEYCFIPERNIFAVPVKDGFTKKIDYLVDKITVDGVDIGEFKIAYGTYSKSEELIERFENEIIGVTLDSTRTASGDGHYIVIDSTGLIENEYSVKVEDGNILIKGSYNSVDAAIEYLCTDLLSSDSKKVELKNGAVYEGKTEAATIYTKDQLMSLLTELYNDPNRYIVGQQAEELRHPMPSVSLDAFYDATGELPGMLGVDLGCYGMYIKDYDDDEWSQAICELVDYAAQGGIVEVSSHYDNPVDPAQQVRGTLGEFETAEQLEQAFKDLITEGTELNKAFREAIEIDGRFLKALCDNGVPVLFRPFHEMNGNWFWYCATSNGLTVSAEVWTALWKYVHDYYTEDLKLDNLIWVYSPNVSSNENDKMGTTMSTMYCFPGKEYCDIVGTDWYFVNTASSNPAGYKDVIDGSGYIGALTEFGPSGDLLADPEKNQNQIDLFNCSDFDKFIEQIAGAGNKFAYVLAWSGQWSIPTMGEGDEYMALDYTLGAKDLKIIFDGMK